VLGQNDKRYKLDTNWGKLDFAQYPVKDCHEMVQDSKGRIILLTMKRTTMLSFTINRVSF
jgi:hypothetical protein